METFTFLLPKLRYGTLFSDMGYFLGIIGYNYCWGQPDWDLFFYGINSLKFVDF